MKYDELKAYFEKNALDEAPKEEGMYLCQLEIRYLYFDNPCLVNVLKGADPDELLLRAGSWSGFVKTNAIKRHCPLKLES